MRKEAFLPEILINFRLELIQPEGQKTTRPNILNILIQYRYQRSIEYSIKDLLHQQPKYVNDKHRNCEIYSACGEKENGAILFVL